MMGTKYKIIEASGNVTERTVNWPKAPKLEYFQKLLLPILGPHSDFEQVSVWVDYAALDATTGDFAARDMFVDDRGKMKMLPRNDVATVLYRNAVMMGKTRYAAPPDPEMLSMIYGTAILFERKVWT